MHGPVRAAGKPTGGELLHNRHVRWMGQVTFEDVQHVLGLIQGSTVTSCPLKCVQGLARALHLRLGVQTAETPHSSSARPEGFKVDSLCIVWYQSGLRWPYLANNSRKRHQIGAGLTL